MLWLVISKVSKRKGTSLKIKMTLFAHKKKRRRYREKNKESKWNEIRRVEGDGERGWLGEFSF